jgi:hypothetical protein
MARKKATPPVQFVLKNLQRRVLALECVLVVLLGLASLALLLHLR